MYLRKRYTILMFSMSHFMEWKKGVRNRNYFVLQELIKRDDVERVIVVEYLPVFLKKKVKNLISRFYFLPKQGDVIYKSFDSVLVKINNKLFIYSSYFLENLNNRLEYLLYKKLNLENVILWSYFPLDMGYFNIKSDIKVFSAVDNWKEHPSYKKYKPQLYKNYMYILEKFDIIFAVSKHLKSKLFKNRNNVHWIPNGVNFPLKCGGSKRQKSGRVCIGYIGNIQSRVDFDLIKYIALNHKDKIFMFVGPIWEDAEIEKVKNISNIKFIGRVKHENLIDYLSIFDIGIIPNKVNEFTRSMDPMKLYEYLSVGIPVISSQKLSVDKNLFYYAKDKYEFCTIIDKALECNNEGLKSKRINFAKANSWKRRVDKMMDAIININN